MTRQGWSERKVDAAYNKFINTYPIKPWTHYAAQTLLAEHKRAVRVVRRELEKFQRRRECETNASQRDMLGGAMLACSNILAALQKGRT
jgi:hypothetical protein